MYNCSYFILFGVVMKRSTLGAADATNKHYQSTTERALGDSPSESRIFRHNSYSLQSPLFFYKTPPKATDESADDSLRLQKVRVIESAYIRYVASGVLDSSIRTKKLLLNNGKILTDIAQLAVGDVIVSHRKQLTDSKNAPHGYIGVVLGIHENAINIMHYEISNGAREESEDTEQMAPLEHNTFNKLGIYKSPWLQSNDAITYLINHHGLYKLFNATVNEVDEAARIVANRLINKRRNNVTTGFYGTAYDCNNFVRDVVMEMQCAQEAYPTESPNLDLSLLNNPCLARST